MLLPRPRFLSRLAYITISLVFSLTLSAAADSGKLTKKLKISVDTSPNHLRNIILRNFTKELQQYPDFAIKTELYESGQLSKDRDIPKALYWGNIEMGVPAQSKLTRFVPEANLFTLPILYGLSSDIMLALLDSKVGLVVNQITEEKLGVKILGKNIILGSTNIYTTTLKLTNIDQLRGLKIRVPGGSGPITLLQELGVNPMALPISDVPLALAQGSMNGIQSSHETVASTKLWEVGIKYCFEDRANLIIYVPMISLKFWDNLTLREQDVLTRTWQEVVSDSRNFSAMRQLQARQRLLANGIECLQPGNEELESKRLQMKDVSTRLAKSLGIDDSLYEALIEQINTLLNKPLARSIEGGHYYD